MNDAESRPYLRLRGVRMSFGARQVFTDLNLDVKRGETLTMLGTSGSGKSVMLKLLIGLLRPDAGSIVFDGQELTSLSESGLLPVRRRISMLFQGGALFDSLSVGDNVAYPLREHLRLSESEISHAMSRPRGAKEVSP